MPIASRQVAGSSTVVWIGLDGRTYLPASKVNKLLARAAYRPRGDRPRLGAPMAVKITARTPFTSFYSYHVYNRGQEFRPVLPRDCISSGTSAAISLEDLQLSSFVRGIPVFEQTNRNFIKWLSDSAIVKSLALRGSLLRILFHQSHPLVDIERFELILIIDRYPGTSNQHGGAYLQCHLADYVGRDYPIRIRHNGVQPPEFQVDRGAGFEAVTLVSYDGFRLSFRYGLHGTTSTIYLAEPSELIYDVQPPRRYCGRYLDLVRGMYSGAFIFESVRPKRRLEQTMLQSGSSYDQGRIGSEIAYVCATRFFDLRNLVIEEPSKGGRDLHTLDTQIAIQARMIRRIPTRRLIQIELLSLVKKLDQDFSYNSAMRTGYAILSFFDNGRTLKTLALSVQAPANRHWSAQ